METGWNENHVELCGRIDGEPIFSHENHGEQYFRFPLTVERLSGVADRVNVIASGRILTEGMPQVGDYVEILGELRSFNNKSGQGSRLIITVLARSLQATNRSPVNHLILAGFLCRPPVLRRTPLGRGICDLMLAVNRKYGRADYLPCIAWGQLARKSHELKVGDGIRIEGRLQSRSYIKVENGESQEKVAYEVSVLKLDPAEQFIL